MSERHARIRIQSRPLRCVVCVVSFVPNSAISAASTSSALGGCRCCDAGARGWREALMIAALSSECSADPTNLCGADSGREEERGGRGRQSAAEHQPHSTEEMSAPTAIAEDRQTGHARDSSPRSITQRTHSGTAHCSQRTVVR